MKINFIKLDYLLYLTQAPIIMNDVIKIDETLEKTYIFILILRQ